MMISTLVEAVAVVDNDDCEAWEHCANLRSVDRFVGALRNVQRTCSYSSLRTLIILIIVHAIMMIINVITIVIVIMRAKTIRIACVQRIAPYSYLLIIFIINSSTLSITITCMPTSSHGGAQLILKSSQTWVETELVVSCDVNLWSIIIVFLESITSMITMIKTSSAWLETWLVVSSYVIWHLWGPMVYDVHYTCQDYVSKLSANLTDVHAIGFLQFHLW